MKNLFDISEYNPKVHPCFSASHVYIVDEVARAAIDTHEEIRSRRYNDDLKILMIFFPSSLVQILSRGLIGKNRVTRR